MIPIENIYFLLCYAWDALDQKEKIRVSAEECTNIYDLLGRVLVNGTNIVVKRGVAKDYLDDEDGVAGVKGKMLFAETLKRRLLPQGKTWCAFDEYSENILLNKILVTTITRLLSVGSISVELREQLRELKMMLSGIGMLELTPRVFASVKISRNNRLYGVLMHVSRLLYENMLPLEGKGCYEFAEFYRNKRQMNQLFESFIRNFYRREQCKYPVVKSEYIDWRLESADAGAMEFLPVMKTDISLYSESSRIIMDAKFYRETMSLRFEKEKIHSGNLYQLFSYLINQRDTAPASMETTGILLYPTIEENYSLDFVFEQHPVKIRTVNLKGSSSSIARTLLNIIGV